MITFRRIIELLSRGIIIRRKIKVNDHNIPIYITPDAQLKYLKLGKNAFDSDLINIAKKFLQKGSNVWDIGGNVGIFTFAASEIATDGKILCVEADIWLASIIMKSKRLKQNIAKDISILPAAISNNNSIAQFLISQKGRAYNSLADSKGRLQMGGIREINYVPTLTLDSLLEVFDKPDFVKIDIEGAELLALQGASNLIANIRPMFYIEIGEDVSKEVFELFNKNNYKAFDYNGLTKSAGSFDNVFFVPSEKKHVF